MKKFFFNNKHRHFLLGGTAVKTSKVTTFLITLFSFVYFFPNVIIAQSAENEDVVALLKSSQEPIALYEDKSANHVLQVIPDGTSVTLLENDNEWALVELFNQDDHPSIKGYVRSQFVFLDDETKEIPQSTNSKQEFANQPNKLDDEPKTNPNQTTDLKKRETTNLATAKTNEQTENAKSSPQLLQQESLYGIALQTTHVYTQPSTNATIIKSYQKGHRLKFQRYNSQWYSAIVIVNGQRLSGFIHANDVKLIENEQTQLFGFAVRQVAVYASPTKNAAILKSYRQGHRLKYRSFSSEWFEATVIINGKAHTGYIHASDVANEPPQGHSQRLKGVATKAATAIYRDRSTTSKVLKTYNKGHILLFRHYDENWFEATVYLNGKAHTGYIHKQDVEVATPAPQSLRGISNVRQTHVYSTATTSAQSLKSYQQGHLLKYRSFSPNWYEATVYINGKPRTGYIYVNDVETAYAASTTLNGIALKKSTRVYEKPMVTSKSLKSYNETSVLKYRSFTPNWHEATVYINGKRHTGYIHASDVEAIVKKQERLEGFAVQKGTKVYSKPTKSSSILKTYAFGSKLIYRTFTTNWYEATVYVNGKRHTGYIHKNDVTNSNGKVIVIDAGHGGTDPGAVGNGLLEKEITLDIALRTKQLLEETGFTVIMTRESDVYPSLKQRTDLANNANADIFVSIHVNAGGGTGIETWWHDKAPEPQKRQLLATYIQNELIAATGARNRGVKSPTRDKGNFHVTRETKMPSALVEVGFIDNASDAAKLSESSYRQQIATGIVQGIIRYFS